MVRSRRLLALLLSGWVGSTHSQGEPPSKAAGASPRAAEDPALAVFPDDPSRNVVIRACAPCHAPELVVTKRRSVDEWDQVIATMIDRGAVADDDEQALILDYLVHFFGTAADGGGARE